MHEAARFLTDATPFHDRWFLFVDEFDPHEPFDTPAPWLGRYDDEPWTDDLLIWPPYADGAIVRGQLTEREGRHIRGNYGSKLSMIDAWFGRILDAFDARGSLGRHRARSCAPTTATTSARSAPGATSGASPACRTTSRSATCRCSSRGPASTGGGTCDALTTSVDLFATIADAFDATVAHPTHGRSLVPLLTGAATSVRDWAIGGTFGNWVQVTDGTHKYARGPAGDQFPLSMWSNRWSTMPLHIAGWHEPARPRRPRARSTACRARRSR